ncbi:MULTISPECIES: ATP-binding cassette domain-containing protein [Gammaproteobacteria]|uniref:ATP-binding cassette domain-containing protein n=1 Tax=Gammaproteobacteria TaxID=1236 RepID=UPI001ADCFB9F|nr:MULTISPECIES: ATP-binding cassette domain-containing protein [Gammaproteobacteria]MBO9481790.1 ATP-binding cassette domain-containing protein [Salinisphaera sp. G21_0]MBO9495079.1 ATP-binding cassette domain-containing protein [Thalassotalea sp. G20_0]
MITLNSISLLRSGKLLLENASTIIHSGQHVGLVGANGCGKSSLLALLTGDLQPDKGELAFDKGRGLAHMAQEIDVLDRNAVGYVLDGDIELRRIEQAIAEAEAAGKHEKLADLHEQLLSADGYTARSRAEQLLHGLGFNHQVLKKNVRDFSGGWRMRLNLAKTLMCPSDIMLLDEPTNHLDLDAIVWLENFLKRYPGTLLVISHDRDFLDAITDHTLHIEHQTLFQYRGNYSAFEHLRAQRLQQQQAAFEKQQKLRAHMEKFVERFRAKATKAKQAQSRLKALARLEDISAAHVDSPFSFAFPEADKMSAPLLVLDTAELGYGDKPLLKLSINIQPGSRIGLLGANGAGKSTLIRTLAGELPLISGKVHLGEHLSIGYFAQHQLESLDFNASPLLHLQRLSPEAKEQTLRNFLGGFGFHGDKALESIQGFSGGEKARLALAIIGWQKPNLLLLDEPTNHLDLDMRLALTMALQSFEGAVILVSHDRNLIRSTTDELYLVHDGRMEEYSGDLDDYSQWLVHLRSKERNESRSARSEESGGELVGSSQQNAQQKKDIRRHEAERRKALRPLKQKAEQLESQLEDLQSSLEQVEERLSDPLIYEETAKEKLKELLSRQTALKQQALETEEAWMEALEAIENAETNG